MEDALKFWGGRAKQRGFVWGRAVIVLTVGQRVCEYNGQNEKSRLLVPVLCYVVLNLHSYCQLVKYYVAQDRHEKAIFFVLSVILPNPLPY